MSFINNNNILSEKKRNAKNDHFYNKFYII